MIDETAFLAALRPLATHPAARGLADDVAVLPFGDATLILTHDMMVEGVHWLPDQDPADVAWKLVASNLSDLAAKGAEPVGVLLGATLGADPARFIAGLQEALAAFAVPLLGGDTVAAAPGSAGRGVSHGLTALGRATWLPVPARSGARVGDQVWVTGVIGAAMLGFEALRAGTAATPPCRFRRPVPRLAEGRALAPLVSAMMDVSDGLLLDAGRLARASGVTVALTGAAIPLAPGLDPARRREAIGWGDDYELLFTLPRGCTPPVAATLIGEVLPAGDAPLLLDGAAPQGALGWVHPAA